jgi:phosphoglycolate phosphatase-like HAD superfamily hydrolase
VIADTFHLFFEIFVNTQRALGAGRLPTIEDAVSLEEQSFRGVAEIIGIPKNLISRFETDAFERLNKIMTNVNLFPEIPPVLTSLAKNHDICIITLNKIPLIIKTLKSHGVVDAITKVYGYETGLTKQESIMAAQSDFRADAHTTYFIGDAASDLRAAKQAGVKTVAVTWGFQKLSMLLREAPDALAHHPNELLEYFK